MYPHPANPVKTGLNGTRGAGEFIEVDGNMVPAITKL
jgi:hypothetical protein